MKTPESSNLDRATERSKEARQQLANTLVELQSRLAPQRLLREGLDELRVAAEDAGRTAIDHIRARPGQAAGVAIGIILFLARDAVAALLSRIGRRTVQPLRKRRVEGSRQALPRKDRP